MELRASKNMEDRLDPNPTPSFFAFSRKPQVFSRISGCFASFWILTLKNHFFRDRKNHFVFFFFALSVSLPVIEYDMRMEGFGWVNNLRPRKFLELINSRSVASACLILPFIENVR